MIGTKNRVSVNTHKSIIYTSLIGTHILWLCYSISIVNEQGRSLQCYANFAHCAAHTVVPCSVLLTLTYCAAPCQ